MDRRLFLSTTLSAAAAPLLPAPILSKRAIAASSKTKVALLGQALIQNLTHAAQSTKDKQRSAALWMHVAELLADKKHDTAGGIAALSRVTRPRYSRRRSRNKLRNERTGAAAH